MIVVPLPPNLAIGHFEIGQRRYDVGDANEQTGAGSARGMGPSRWTLGIAAPTTGLTLAQASLWESTLLKLRGGINYLSAYDIIRTQPRGTFRGFALNGAHAKDADILSILGDVGQAGNSLLRGDWAQVSVGPDGQLVKVVADAVANESGNISII